MMEPVRNSDIISFGPFKLVKSERLLTKDGAVLELGSRTLDTLMALLARPNQVISKRDLLAQVWPDVIVEEGSLRFHIAALRKALDDGKSGARYITTLAGRGYCFVAPIARSRGLGSMSAPASAPFGGPNFLPPRLARMVGGHGGVLALSTLLVAARFVTIVGPAGVGKTTMAVAVAHEVIASFDGASLFMDLGMVSDPAMVAASLALMLGLSMQPDDPTPSLLVYLRDRRVLLVLDNCEHLIGAAADLAVRIFQGAAQVHILATSREALRVEGERVHILQPLDVPPDAPSLTATAALRFPAIQLFVERAVASGAPLELDDLAAATVASICRQLDGVPLAVELAAARVAAYGLQQTASLLDQRLTLHWPGPRSAPPRQRTLQATLDWSYQLLSELERTVFRRLSVFVGHFTIQAAIAVVTCKAIDQGLVFGAIDSLVAKSMVATRPQGAMMRYRLLETSRAYARAIAVEDAERTQLAERHAAYYQQWLEQTGGEWPTLLNATERGPYLVALGNVRAALEWCFGPGGHAERGIGLAAAAAPVLLAMSLLTECHRWSERALLALYDTACGGPQEMQLQAALGMALMFTRGSSDAVRMALERGLALAEQHGDDRAQLRLLSTLHMFHSRIGDLKTSMHYAKCVSAVSRAIAEPAALALAHALLGLELHLCGEIAAARAELDAALHYGPNTQQASAAYLGFDGYNIASIALARVLWLQGHPTQAIQRARQAITDADKFDHPVTLSVVLIWAVSLFLWAGDLDRAAEHIDWFAARARSYAMGPYLAVARGFEGQLAIVRGDVEAGIEHLQTALAELRVVRYEQVTVAFTTSLVQGLTAMGRCAEATGLIDGAIQCVEDRGDLSYMPELLRVRGCALLALSEPRHGDAEQSFLGALELSRRQGAPAWELRVAIDLAALLKARGRPESARALLQPILERFVEGVDTADLKAACSLIELG